MIECSKASLLRCRNCKHVKCDKYKIMQILKPIEFLQLRSCGMRETFQEESSSRNR